MKDLRLFSRKHPDQTTPVRLNERVVIGGNALAIMAGPCAVESWEQVQAVATTLQELGISSFRGGVFKPRTSPYSFQGMAGEGLDLLGTLSQQTGLAIISEVMSVEHLLLAAPYFDCFQVGSRNMQNFELLKALGRQEKPVLLKRGLSATIEEFLYAAEYIMAEGNPNVILCERGIRSFDPMTRNVLDLAAVALLKELTHLPVVVDPSHATGKRSLILPTAKAAIAVGADGIMVEAHPHPEQSISDAAQALSLQQLGELTNALKPIAAAIGRPLDQTEATLPQLALS